MPVMNCMCSIKALIGAKPVPLASRISGLAESVAQEEAAVRALHAQDVLFLHGTEHMVGELAAGHVADVQLDRGRACPVVRRVGHAVAAARAVAQDELDVLAGVVLEVLVGRQLQRSTMTSSAARSSDSTRVGSFSTGCSPAPGTLRASTTQSDCGRAQQVRIRPAASSSVLSALAWCGPWTTRPSSSRLLHEPQAPSRQP
jgi:hypothetical protein